MGLVFPLPSSRTSDFLMQRRLLLQYQSDQIDLLRIQSQVATGRRISRPSEDPRAAGRAFNLQRLIEEKGQAKINLNTTTSYLAATDSAISNVSAIITDARGVAITSAQSTLSDSQRQANAEVIDNAIGRLLNIGNHRFRDRYLFAGSRTTDMPFTEVNGNVLFNGNETALRSYADLDYLFANNVSGQEIFGALSPEVRGTTDLNPILTERTRLSDLRGGLGIRLGSILVSDGNSSKTIDISSAHTIEDVADLIRNNPPTGRTLTVRVTNTGLSVDIDDAGGGNLTIAESGGATTAAELGILNTTGTGTSPIVGTDLDPVLSLTTSLRDLLGTPAAGTLVSSGTDNDVIVRSKTNGAVSNGIVVQYVDDAKLHASPGLSVGNETASFTAVPVAARAALTFSGFNNNVLLTANTAGVIMNNVRIDVVNAGAIGNAANVSYNAGTKVLTIGIDSGNATTVQTLINAVNSEGTFSAAYDASFAADGGFVPGAAIQASDARSGFGDTGNSGGSGNTLFVFVDEGNTTANHVVDAINNDPTVSALFSAELDSADNSSSLAAGMGVINVNANATLAGGTGEQFDQTSGIRIVNGGQTYNVDVSSAETIEDLLNILNTSDANVLATLNADSTGIDLRSRLSGSDFSVGENGGTTATQLGIRSFNRTTPLSELNFGRGVQTISGPEFHITRTDGVTVAIDLSSAATIGDVLDTINAAGGLEARLATYGNGIEIEDTSSGTGSLTLNKVHLSSAVQDLGLIPNGQGSVTGSGSPPVITGTDVNPLEVKGLFTTMIRLKRALQDNDLAEIERTGAMLDDDLQRLGFARSELGTRQQGLDSLKNRMEDEEVELKTTLSLEIDTDLSEAISNLLARQAALEASLRLTGQAFQLSLINFL